jgi:hypothetical protein
LATQKHGRDRVAQIITPDLDRLAQIFGRDPNHRKFDTD